MDLNSSKNNLLDHCHSSRLSACAAFFLGGLAQAVFIVIA